MKLFYAPTSAYVRKVSVVIRETGLLDKIDIVFDAAKVLEPTDTLLAHNPLGKIPTLLLDDGVALFDSRVICEYLDAHSVAAKVFPASGAARWEALSQQALADGLVDAAMLTRQERLLRAPNEQSEDWYNAQYRKIRSALARLEVICPSFSDAPTIGTIAIGCALGFLDFRFAEMGWRTDHPVLGAWFDRFDQRPAMVATRPQVAA